VIDAAAVGRAVYEGIRRSACDLRPDVLTALRAALETERSERGREVLRQLADNAAVASADSVPLCQDTGTAWVRLELGAEEGVRGDVLAAIDVAVAEAYRDLGLRMSLVRDALLDRSNTGDNTPAFIEVVLRDGVGATVDVMLKGGGSDNASSLVMLPPSAGLEGVREAVLAAVEAKATGACPPLLVGVGVGTTFDKVAALAKHALLRPIGTPPADERLAAIEAELLVAINATGIGPAGLGGDTTALGVHMETAPCHIAALPLAVNLGCCAIRSARVEVA